MGKDYHPLLFWCKLSRQNKKGDSESDDTDLIICRPISPSFWKEHTEWPDTDTQNSQETIRTLATRQKLAPLCIKSCFMSISCYFALSPTTSPKEGCSPFLIDAPLPYNHWHALFHQLLLSRPIVHRPVSSPGFIENVTHKNKTSVDTEPQHPNGVVLHKLFLILSY